jgi:predicted SAM-dependent methyltransferase
MEKNKEQKAYFNFDGKKGEIDLESKEILIDGKQVWLNRLSLAEIAKINKGIRDYEPCEKTKLNIGCGHRPMQDAINLDYDELCYPDVLRNIEEGLPFDDNKFEYVYTSHLIEHVKDVFFFMYEIWRVSKNKAKVEIIAPYCGHLDWAIQPDHLRFINWGFFDRWRPTHLSVQTETKQTRSAFFNIIYRELINEAREIRFELEVVK